MKLFEDRRWKTWLIVTGIIVLSISTTYTYYITNKLAEREATTIDLIAFVYEDMIAITNQDINANVNIHNELMARNTTIPLMIVDESGGILGQLNFREETFEDYEQLRPELDIMVKKGVKPLEVKLQIFENNVITQYIYYKNSKLLQLLSYFPLFQLLLIATFVAYGLYGLNAARHAEQNKVWAGLAKETAHQLGTPISAIIAWISLLDTTLEKTDENQEILTELDKDVKRLNLIAERFSKVGSKPELSSVSLKSVVEEALDYMKRRASRNVRFVYDEENTQDLNANINPPLFEWVVENLLRNALDAMGSKGNIVIDIYSLNGKTCLDISDTGKGIPHNKFKTVFEPGYSTKKRGWGLGLSLAKRIIEMYHKGRIYVKESKLNVGTTFTIELPKK